MNYNMLQTKGSICDAYFGENVGLISMENEI